MAVFRVGMRVRIVYPGWKRDGCEATIWKAEPHDNHRIFGAGFYYYLDVAGIGRTNEEWRLIAYPAEFLEPILPEGAQPSEFTTFRDLMDSLEGVRAMTTEPAFQYPEPELGEAVRQGIEAHKQVTQEREAQWIAHCQRLLREGESGQ